LVLEIVKARNTHEALKEKYMHLRTIIALSIIIVVSGCKVGEITRAPVRAAEPVALKAEPSMVNITARINLEPVRAAADDAIPEGAMQLPRTHEDRCVNVKFVIGSKWIGCDYWGGAQKRGPLVLNGSGDTLSAALPMHLWASVKGLGIQESTDANVTARLSAKPKLGPDWNLSVNPDASFTWDSHPEIVLLGLIKVGIQNALTGPMQAQLTRMVNKIAAKLEGPMVRDRAAVLWAAAAKPIQVSKTENTWMRINLQEAYFSGLNTNNGILTTSFGASATTEAFVGIEPAPLPAKPLPPLQLTAPNDLGFHLALPVSVSYQSMVAAVEKVVKKGEKWAPIPSQPNLLLTIDKIDIYPSHGSLAVKVDFTADVPKKLGDTSGTVFLSGVPVLNNVTKEFSVDKLAFTAQTNNKLINLVTDVLQPAIEQRISDALRVNLKNQYDTLLAESSAKMTHDFGQGMTSQGSLKEARLSKVFLTDQAAVVQINVDGRLEISFGLEP